MDQLRKVVTNIDVVPQFINMYGANSNSAKSLEARFNQDIPNLQNIENPPLEAEDEPLLAPGRPSTYGTESGTESTFEGFAHLELDSAPEEASGIARRHHQIK